MLVQLSALQVGNKFIVSEPANVTVASGFIVKLPVGDKNVFTVVKKNQKTVITKCETVAARFISNKELLILNLMGLDIGEVLVKIF